MPKTNDKKDDKVYNKPANTLIGQGVNLRAKRLTGAESVRIDGLYTGDIELEGYLQVGESGSIEGNIQVSYALIAGRIVGNISCRATVHLSPGAVVLGDIITGKVIIDEGAIFHGMCKTRYDETEELMVV